MNYRRLAPIATLLLTLLLLAYAPASLVRARAPGYAPGATIIFVVDQSGSMRDGPILNQASGARGPASDPDGLALLALNSGIQPIFQRIVLSELERISVDLVGQEHEIGVVLFGGGLEPNEGSVRIAVPITKVEIQRDKDGNVTSNIDGLLPKNPSNLGDTAFSGAFDAVCTMINCDQGPPPGRKQIVVLLTDGAPARDTISYNINEPTNYFNALGSRFSGLFKNSELWVLGLDRSNRFWSINQPFWEKIAPGHTRLLTNPSDIAPIFSQIALEAIGEPLAPPRVCDGTSFSVEPYKASLSLILEYPDVNSKAEFFLPSGEKLTRKTAAVAGYTRSALSESFVITDPVPGEWRCQIVGTGVTPQFRDIQGLFRVTNLEIGRFGDIPSACRDFNLTITYRDRNNKPIAEIPEYPLNQLVTVVIDGTPIKRNLIAVDSQRTVWRIDGDLTPSEGGGTYPLDISVSLAKGSQATIFADTSHSITIDPRLPCLSVVAPTNGGVSSMHDRLSPVGVTLDVLLSQGGNPAQLEGIFREDVNKIITGTLLGPSHLSRDVVFSAVPEKPGLFRALVNDLPTTLSAGGVYTFTAQLTATTQAGERYALATPTISFTREPGTFWRAVQIAIRVAALAAVLIVLTLIGLFILLITPPYPHGILVVQRRVTGDAAAFRQWDDLHTFSFTSAKLFGILPMRWVTLLVKSKTTQTTINIRRARAKYVKVAREEGISATLFPAKKGSSKREFTFTRHGQSRDLGGDLRLLYQDYGKQRP